MNIKRFAPVSRKKTTPFSSLNLGGADGDKKTTPNHSLVRKGTEVVDFSPRLVKEGLGVVK
jgi:hypothetical protein